MDNQSEAVTTPEVPKPEVPKTAREMIDLIDRFFLSKGMDGAYGNILLDEGCRLWTLLTALRGPDNDNTDLKDETTAAIRGLLFPKSAVYLKEYVTIDATREAVEFRNRVDEMWDQRELVERGGRHFFNHIHEAAVVLEELAKESAEEKKNEKQG